MDTTFNENGKQYKIVGGRVVEASATPIPQEETVELKVNDRVVVGKKLGAIVGLVETVYGKTAAIKFDDGTVTERVVDDLERAPFDKTAAVSAEGFEGEYESYLAMPTDTTEEIEVKADKARELNLRAKAFQTNSKNSLADQILYDRVITATYVDTIDLRDAAQRSAAADEGYLESLPKYDYSPQIYRGASNTEGDASWLANVADDVEPTAIDESTLVDRATKIVASYNREQLEDDSFMKSVLAYAFEGVPAEAKTQFASYVKEARTQKLAQAEDNTRVASTVSEKDLDGNDINLDDVPMEAIFG